MPSSTSSFRRPVPVRPWRRIALTMIVLVVGCLATWEWYWRNQGKQPSMDNTEALWSSVRQKVTREPGASATVIIGASRSVFDVDLDEWEQAVGERPLLLGLSGACARVFLADLAAEPNFHGRVVVGMMPSLFYSNGGPYQNAVDYVDYYHSEWTPAKRFSQKVGAVADANLAFLNKEELSFKALYNQWLAEDPFEVGLPEFAVVTQERRHLMIDRVTEDLAFRAGIRRTFMDMLRGATAPSDAEFMAMATEVAVHIAAIRARGGDVVFVRFPASGNYLVREQSIWPRAAYWDRLLAVTAARGIHFQDHPSLNGFECPEWSHLTVADAASFTRGLAPLVAAAFAAGPPNNPQP